MEISKDISELLIHFNNLLNTFTIKLCRSLLGVSAKCVPAPLHSLVWFLWLTESPVMTGDVAFFIEFSFSFILLVLDGSFMRISWKIKCKIWFRLHKLKTQIFFHTNYLTWTLLWKTSFELFVLCNRIRSMIRVM